MLFVASDGLRRTGFASSTTRGLVTTVDRGRPVVNVESVRLLFNFPEQSKPSNHAVSRSWSRRLLWGATSAAGVGMAALLAPPAHVSALPGRDRAEGLEIESVLKEVVQLRLEVLGESGPGVAEHDVIALSQFPGDGPGSVE